MKGPTRCLLLIALVAALCSSMAVRPPTAGAVSNTYIAFERDFQIWTMDPDGSNQFQVMYGSAHWKAPTWSGDHGYLAFIREGAHPTLWHIPIEYRVTPSKITYRGPSVADGDALAWSANGRFIAGESWTGGTSYLTVLDLRHHRSKKICKLVGINHIASLSWSPDHKKLLVCEELGDSYQMLLVDVAHKDVLKIYIGSIAAADWSPHGSRIVYQMQSVGGDRRIMTMRPDGSHKKMLCHRGDGGVSWSPGGRSIVFLTWSEAAGAYSAWTMRADGSHKVKIATDCWRPAWK